MTNYTTSPLVNSSTAAATTPGAEPVATHLDRALDDAMALLLTAGLVGSVICDGSCNGVASCCVAPVGVAGAPLAA